MVKESRKMRREGNKGWKTARKVFRSLMIKGRYEKHEKRVRKREEPNDFQREKRTGRKQSDTRNKVLRPK